MWLLGSILRWLRPPSPVGDDWDTEGPPSDEHPLVSVGQVVKAGSGTAGIDTPPAGPAPWFSGWWLHAKQKPAHPGRIGPAIVPKTVVVHTTDMHASTFNALVKAWTTKGPGPCAHFIIGRNETEGVVQLAPITRNGSHAGGKEKGKHGYYKTAAGKLIHPNTVAVGIEVHANGKLKKQGASWVCPESGRVIPTAEVFLDSRKQGWHLVNAYQIRMLKALLDDLKPCLVPLAPGMTIVSHGTYQGEGVPWGDMEGATQIVGHVTLDPRRKNDPGPQVMAWLKANYS